MIREMNTIDRLRCSEHNYIYSGGDPVNVHGAYGENKPGGHEELPVFRHHWFGLYNILTYQEANALYRHLKTVAYRVEQKIVYQDEPDTRLYFLNKGTVYVTRKLKNGTNNTFVLGEGCLIGFESYFKHQDSMYSVVAWDDTELDCLERKDLDLLAEEYPDIEMKLHEFSASMNRDIVEPAKGLEERRKFPRLKTSGSVAGALFDSSGASMDVCLNGTMIDISKGGFSFSIVHEKDLPLVGCGIEATLNLELNNKINEIHWGGVIVDVSRVEQSLVVRVKGIKQ